MFLTYWLFNAYFFPKPEQTTTTAKSTTEIVQKKEGLSKPIINLTNDGIIIFSDVNDGDIRYNFAGTEPTVNDELYLGIIKVTDPDQVTKIRAKVFYNDQESHTAFYTKDLKKSELVQGSDIESVVLENDKLRLVFSPKDGVLSQAYAKEFKLGKDKIVQLIPEKSFLGVVEINNADLSDLIYFKEVDGNRVKFSLKDNSGNVVFAKEYILTQDYRVDFNLYFNSELYKKDYMVKVPGIADTEMLSYKETNPDKYFKNKAMDYKLIALDTNEIVKQILTKLKSSEITSHTDNVKWVASRSKYFVISLFGDQVIADKKFVGRMENESPAFDFIVENSDFESEYEPYYFYLGPVDKDYIEVFDSSLIFDRVIERSWTWLHWLSKIFELVMQNLAKVIPNYGIVVIIFALLIKLILYPLTHKSFENSMKMQKVQPYLSAIQKKYKSDPMKMQQEMSKVKKEHGVSTLGGCLPMLIQMPIFFALYPTLRYSISLRGASFFGWLQDLSSPDPYYILPIIMGIFMFLQQKMMTDSQMSNTNSQDMDEKQAAMMQSQKMMAYILPVMMFFVFRKLPSGLVLYWTVFNILSIIQQHFINKKFRGR